MLFIILNLFLIDIYFIVKGYFFYKKRKIDRIYNSVLKGYENNDLVKSFMDKFGGVK